MSLNYAWQKLSLSVMCMATSRKPLQERLEVVGILSLSRLQDEDFPEGELRESFRRIMYALTSQLAKGDEGKIRSSTLVMEDKEASELIEDIIWLYDKITRIYEIDHLWRHGTSTIDGDHNEYKLLRVSNV